MNCAFMITSDSVDWLVKVHSTAGFQLCSVGERNRQKCSQTLRCWTCKCASRIERCTGLSVFDIDGYRISEYRILFDIIVMCSPRPRCYSDRPMHGIDRCVYSSQFMVKIIDRSHKGKKTGFILHRKLYWPKPELIEGLSMVGIMQFWWTLRAPRQGYRWNRNLMGCPAH